jgi:hypothetical protein
MKEYVELYREYIKKKILKNSNIMENNNKL